MFSRWFLSEQNKPFFLIRCGTLVCGISFGALSGCTLGPELIDEYPAYGGIFQRMDQNQGRAGSVFSDPNLMADGGAVEIVSGYESTLISEDETIDAILETDSVTEKAFWRGRQGRTVEIIEGDTEIVFDEEIH